MLCTKILQKIVYAFVCIYYLRLHCIIEKFKNMHTNVCNSNFPCQFISLKLKFVSYISTF